MKKLLAILFAILVICSPLYAYATTGDWVLFCGSDDIVAGMDAGGFGAVDGELTISLKNSELSKPVDTSLPLPDNAITSYILGDPQWSTVLNSFTKQTLTEAGTLKGRFVIMALDFNKIGDDVQNHTDSDTFMVTQVNDAYAGLGLSAPSSGEMDYATFLQLDMLTIPIMERTESKLVIYGLGDIADESGDRPVEETYTVIIDAKELSFAPLATHVSGFDRLAVSPNQTSRVAPALSYTARAADGVRDMSVPGHISWSFSDPSSSGGDYALNGANLAALSAFLRGASYPVNTQTDLSWTASPVDQRFTSVSGTLIVESVEGAPHSQNTMAASAVSVPPTINTSHNSYDGYGDFLIQTGSMRSQLSGVSINGIALAEGLDYTIEETSGNIAIIRVYESVMRDIAVGNAQITVNFTSGSVNATVMIEGFYVPEILTDPPKTGDAQTARGFYLLLCGIALALAAVYRRRCRQD